MFFLKKLHCSAFVKRNAPTENNPLKLRLDGSAVTPRGNLYTAVLTHDESRFAQGRTRACFLFRISFYTRCSYYFSQKRYELINNGFKNKQTGSRGCPLVMLRKVRGLEREKHRFEGRGVFSLQENI